MAVLTLTLALGLAAGRVGAEEVGQPLQLEVVVNGSPTNLVGSFTMLPDRRIAARRSELKEIGLEPRRHGSPGDLISLDDLNGLTYRYEEATQRIFITAPDELRAVKEYSASSGPREKIPVQRDYGGVLNYNLFAASGRVFNGGAFGFQGGSATLDARGFTPFGTLSQSGIVRTSVDNQAEALRLDTTLAYSDDESLITYRGGDVINSGLAWTRPIRIGGVQAQRNFGLRPDLITLPLPAATGSAALPSTVDVYLNNMKTFSQDINAGPYRINNLPAVSGSGSARIVIRDSSGRETESSMPFFASSYLLAPGLTDFSFDAGFPRLSYGTPSDAYLNKFVGSGSFRSGLFDWLTVEGHAEAGAGLWNAGAGAALRAGSLGVASLALAASQYQGKTGFQGYVAMDTEFMGVRINASSQRTFGPYDDLASVTARLNPNVPQDSFGGGGFDAPPAFRVPSLWANARPPKAFDRISVGMPLFNRSSLSLSFIHLEDSADVRSKILAASWSSQLPYNMSVFATAFSDFGDRKNNGFLVGLSAPLGDTITASTSVSGGKSGTQVTADVVKPLDVKPGSLGWRLHDTEGSNTYRSAAVGYRSTFARTEANVAQDRNGARGTAEIDGSVVTMGGGVFLANRIDDAFAVVETGAPGVEVFYENRSVGVTDASGRILVPGLRSYQRNKIAIDTTKLPVDAAVGNTQATVAPADRSGVRVNFGVQSNIRPAIVVLRKSDGAPLPVGSRGQVEGGETFVIGYDGQAYIKNLNPQNTVTVALADSQCNASFPYAARPNEQVIISPVICR
jgi:outer membrane usher protein